MPLGFPLLWLYTTSQLTEKLAGALEHVSLVNYELLLPLSSGFEAIATIAGEITFTTMKRIQSKLVEVAHVLPQLLSESSFQNVFNLVHRFTNIGVYLLEVSCQTKLTPCHRECAINTATPPLHSEVSAHGNSTTEPTSMQIVSWCYCTFFHPTRLNAHMSRTANSNVLRTLVYRNKCGFSVRHLTNVATNWTS